MSDSAGNPDLYLMNADGSGVSALTSTSVHESSPAWSPDGRRIAFGVEGDIFVMNVDGSGRVNLTDSAASEAFPSWSPDGSRIAYHQTTASTKHDVYVMNADGTDRSRLTPSDDEDVVPSWSPDGSRIAFSAWRSGNYDVYVMDTDGTDEKRLTFDPAMDSWPSWSPDGSLIAFTSWRDLDEEVYVMAADGSGQTRLTQDGARDAWPSWQPLVAPSAPQEVAVSPGDSRIDVSWKPPAAPGTYPVTGYEAVARPVSGGDPVSCTTSGATGCVITGLRNGTAYSVTVRASNAVGQGPQSAAVTAPPGAASPPASPSAVAPPAVSPTARPVTTLRVKALKRSTSLKVGRRYLLVRRVSTNGRIVRATATCTLRGKKVKPTLQRKVCGIRVTKSAASVRIVATPKCSARVAVSAQVRARAAGSESATFSRRWQVGRAPRVVCPRLP